MGQSENRPTPIDDIAGAVHVLRGNGAGPVVLVCEHASHTVPARLANSFAPNDVLVSHAGWDPGAADIASLLSEELQAPLISAAYSRLVFDVNRAPDSPDAIRFESEIHNIPSNRNLSDEERCWRIENIYEPFHAEIDDMLKRRARQGQASVLVTIHTFAPVYFGRPRDVEIGILHDNDSRLADEILVHASGMSSRRIERNEPYGPEDGVTHTLARHALPRKLLNVMIEVRNDLVSTTVQQERIVCELAAMMRDALRRLGVINRHVGNGANS